MSSSSTITLSTPILQTNSYNIVSYTIYSVTIDLYTSCSVFLLLNTDIGTQFSKVFVLTTEQYLGWNNNDSYITNLIDEHIMTIINS
jgi:hypothetical protein